MKQPTAAQKRWMSDIAVWAMDNMGILYGEGWEGCQFHLHHVLGRSAKHNKVAIGHDFIIPVPIELHDISSNHSLNVTFNKKAFVNEFGSQSGIFQVMFSVMDHSGYDVPSVEVYNAIMDTKV